MAEVLLLFRENDIKSAILLEKVVDKNPIEMPHDHNCRESFNARTKVKVRSGHAEKQNIQQLLQDMSHLKIKIQSMEKDLGPLIFLRKSMSGYVYSELREFDMQLTVARRSEETQIKRNLKKVRSMVSTFSKSVDAPRCPPPETVHKLKVLMEDIEIGITDMKARQAESYKELQRDEKSLCAEIQALQKRFESWQRQTPASANSLFLTKAPPAPILEESTHDLPPEVKDFEMFVACTGGLSGGWDDFDQGTFVRIYCTHKGHPTMKQFLAGLPTKTEGEVHRHVGWYMEYQGLLEKKKEAIQEWRQKKEFEKTILAKEAMTKLTEAEEEKEKAKKMIQLKEEIQNTKMAIHRWKMEKNLAKEDEDRKKDQERARIRNEEENKQLERRAFTEVYNRQKQDLKMKMEEESRKMDTLTKLKEKMSEAERKENVRQNIARFQERDQAVLKKKMDQVRARERESEEREARLIKLIGDQDHVTVPRDPDRLLKPTKGWMERQKAKATEGGDGGPSLQMPHRAVPTWRQNLY